MLYKEHQGNTLKTREACAYMKRLWNVFLSVLLLITAVMTSNYRIYAEEDGNITTSETEVLSESSEDSGNDTTDKTFLEQEPNDQGESNDQDSTEIHEESETLTENKGQDEASITGSEEDELNVFLNLSGDVILTCNDTDWLMARCEPEDYPDDQQKGVIAFVNSTGYWFRCSNTGEGPVYYYEDGKVIVPAAFMRAHGIIDGSYTFKFMTTAFGSQMKEYNTPISISGVCIEHPYDIDILPQDNYDIVISSKTAAYISAFTHAESRVVFINNTSGSSYEFDNNDYTVSGKSLTIPAAELEERKIPEGDYTAYLHVYGYATYEGPVTLGDYTAGIKVTIRQSSIGDLVITSDNTGFMQALAKANEFDSDGSAVYGGRIEIIQEGSRNVGYSNVVEYENGVEINRDYTYTLSTDKKQITLKRQEMLNRHVYSGSAIINLYPAGYESISREITLNQVSDPLVPDDVQVNEQNNGDITISSLNTAWLNALCRASDYGNNVYPGEIVFIDDSNPYDIYIHNDFHAISYSYSNSRITISSDSLIRNRIKNGNYHLAFFAYGYKQMDYPYEITVTGGIRQIPAGISVVLNGERDLEISVDDTDYVNAFAHPDSMITLENLDDGSSYAFSADSIVVDTDKVTLSATSLKQKRISAGNYRVILQPYGYEDTEFPMILDEYIPEMKISVSQNDNGDLLITADDPDYLNALMLPTGNYGSTNGSAYVQGGQIAVSSDRYTSKAFTNRLDYQNGTLVEDQQYVLSDNTIIISRNRLIDANFYDTDCASVTLHAPAYDDRFFEGVTLQELCSSNLPDGPEITVEENGDITIRSTATLWLDAVAQATEYGSTSQIVSTGGNIRLISYDDGGEVLTDRKLENRVYPNSAHIVYSCNNDTITISADSLKSEHIRNGSYTILLTAKGYKVYEYPVAIDITGGCEDVPEGIDVRFDEENGDIVVYSVSEDSEDYLRNLADPDRYDVNGVLIRRGGMISFSSAEGNYVFANEMNADTVTKRIILYDEINNEVRIPRTSMYEGMSGDYTVKLKSYGFEGSGSANDPGSSFPISLPYITVSTAEIVAGRSARFVVNTDREIFWSVDDEEMAEVSQGGWLSGKAAGTVLLSAQVDGCDYVDTIPVTIKASSAASLTVTPVKADVTVGERVQIEASVKNAGDYYTLVYESSDLGIAEVDTNGLVLFHNHGTVTITARLYQQEGIIDKTAVSVFTVYDYPKTAGLSAFIDDVSYDPSAGMEVLESAYLTVKAGNEYIDASALEYSSANETIAMIDENGMITAYKPGSVKITAKLIGDPAGRTASFTVKIHARQAAELSFRYVDAGSIIRTGTYDENGVLNLYFDVSDSIGRSIRFSTTAKDRDGLDMSSYSVAYTPVDASVVSVDKNGVATIKKAGQTKVTISVTSNLKDADPVKKEIIFRVMDYAPRLESAKATVNKYYDDGTEVNISAVTGSSIQEIHLLNAKTLEEKDFTVTYVPGENHFNIRQSEAVKKENKGANYAQILRVVTDMGNYDYAYTVSTVLTLPKTTLKATGTYNTALGTSTLGLDVTCDHPYDIEFYSAEGNWMEEVSAYLYPLTTDSKGNPILKGEVRVYYEGYSDERAYNKYTVAFKTIKTLPDAALSQAAVSLNSMFSNYTEVSLNCLDQRYDISDLTVKGDYEAKGLSCSKDGKYILISRSDEAKTGTYKYTITPYITVNGEEKGLKNVSLTVKVANTLPKASLSSSSVKLNLNYDETAAVLLKVVDLPEGATVSDVRWDAVNDDVIEGQDYDTDTGMISFRLPNDRSGLKKGSYKYTLTPVYTDGFIERDGSPLTLTVSLIDAQAKASISIKGNLNQLDPLNESSCIGTIKLNDIQGSILGVLEDDEYVDIFLNEEDKIVFTLTEKAVADRIVDQTLKFNVAVMTDAAVEPIMAPISVKVIRKAPPVKLSTSVINIYDTSQRDTEVGRIDLIDLSYGEVADVWFSASEAFEFFYDDIEKQIIVILKDAANFKSGSSQAITIKIDWIGDYGTYEESLADSSIKGLKTATLKLTIKDASNSVKPKS